MRQFVLFCSLLATPALGHEYWLEPVAYEIPADGMLVADIVNGETFAGNRLPYLPSRTSAYEVRLGAAVAPVEMRAGDRPGLAVPALGDGLTVATLVAAPAVLTYDEFETFLRFAGHKDLLGGAEAVAARHDARGLPREDVREVYVRFCKTLVAAGSGAGADTRVGLETEFVALANPYVDDLSGGLPVALYLGDAPRPDALVEIFDRAPDGTVTVSTARTDAAGVALVPVTAGHDYMLDAVVLREPSAAVAAETGAAWESLWANLTFHVPA